MPDRFAPAAAALLQARLTHQAIVNLPAAAMPRSMAEAYQVQDMVAAGLGAGAGYKVGAASAASQVLIGAGPFAGRVFAEECFASPATVSAASYFAVGVEGEFAFRIGKDMAPKAGGYTRADIMDAVATMVPIIEICDTRLADWRAAGVNQLIADNSFCGGIVYGPPVTDWRGIDFLTFELALSIDGQERGRGTGREVQGHPLDSVTWLANELAQRGIHLKAGELIAAGTCTGLHYANAGQQVTCDFGPYGTVVINVTA